MLGRRVRQLVPAGLPFATFAGWPCLADGRRWPGPQMLVDALFESVDVLGVQGDGASSYATGSRSRVPPDCPGTVDLTVGYGRGERSRGFTIQVSVRIESVVVDRTARARSA